MTSLLVDRQFPSEHASGLTPVRQGKDFKIFVFSSEQHGAPPHDVRSAERRAFNWREAATCGRAGSSLVFVKIEVQNWVRRNQPGPDLRVEIRPANELLTVTAILRPASSWRSIYKAVLDKSGPRRSGPSEDELTLTPFSTTQHSNMKAGER